RRGRAAAGTREARRPPRCRRRRRAPEARSRPRSFALLHTPVSIRARNSIARASWPDYATRTSMQYPRGARGVDTPHPAHRGGNPVPMPVSTWVEVDLDRFASNLRAVRDLLARERARAAPDAHADGGGSAREPEILLVLKADAYGHGAVEMAQAAERE